MRTSPLLCLLAILLGCQPGGLEELVPDPPLPSPPGEEGIHCPNPWQEGSEPRLTAYSTELGLGHSLLEPMMAMGGHVTTVANDLDGDGELDIMILSHLDDPIFFRGLGGGSFEQVDVTLNFDEIPPPDWLGGMELRSRKMNASSVDLDGDKLPELLFTGLGFRGSFVVRLQNLGDFQFGAPQHVFDLPNPEWLIDSHSVADFNGDGLLDLALGVTFMGEMGDIQEVIHPLLQQEPDGDFMLVGELSIPGVGGSLSVSLTDYDSDGLIDLWIPPDLGNNHGLFHNEGNDEEGLPILVERAQEVGMIRPVNAMGMDSADLNGDGFFDYVLSDLGIPAVMYSSPQGFVEVGAALGIEPIESLGELRTVGWSVDWADMDNDGLVDLVHASGTEANLGEGPAFPDLLWQQEEDGTFIDRSTFWGFDSAAAHFGMSTADFNGDGFLDILTAAHGEPPTLYLNACSDAAWLEVQLDGLPGNREGYGARIVVNAQDEVPQMREILHVRAMGQNPPRAHFGLGTAASQVRLDVHWPDGATSSLDPAPLNRLLTITHPDSER